MNKFIILLGLIKKKKNDKIIDVLAIYNNINFS